MLFINWITLRFTIGNNYTISIDVLGEFIFEICGYSDIYYCRQSLEITKKKKTLFMLDSSIVSRSL